MSGTTVLKEKWAVLGRHEQAAGWLTVWTDLGRAPRTIDAYGRGLARKSAGPWARRTRPLEEACRGTRPAMRA
ncbi:hypothetical protein ACFYSF_33085 [Streptomyces canus]|uniref:hypothetical protein n=1 Tax=Streptomyces TaxID=1883 RepID=UPI00099FBE75|nr:hypothetical protein [Streptomyces sp. LUP47B]